MREHRSKTGKLIYFASRLEIEQLPGYRGNDHRGRACCPIHNGTNPTALAIDWDTGWATCWSCGDAFSIRIEDHPGTHQAREDRPQSLKIAPRRVEDPIRGNNLMQLTENALVALETAITVSAARLPGSPGAAYLKRRGISLEVAQSLRLGWSTSGKLAGRVIFPLCGPDGRSSSAMGRAIDDRVKPKYDTLRNADGYQKTLFNGSAIVQARRSGQPLVIVEGPMDAAACVAAGISLTVAICGKSYAHPEHFAGLETVILALDADDAGQQGRRTLWLELTARGIEVLILPVAALAGANDLCEYWQQRQTLPMQLLERVIGPHRQGSYALPTQAPGKLKPDISGHPDGLERAPGVHPARSGDELPVQLPADWWYRDAMTPDELPAALKLEAETLALTLAGNLEELRVFADDLFWNETMLEVEDRCAARYAVQLARASVSESYRGNGA